MNIGDLVRVHGIRDWATHRIVEGSRQCPFYVKSLFTGIVSPLDETKYEVVESAARVTERIILGHDEFIPVHAVEIAKGDTPKSFTTAKVTVDSGEGIFGFILPGYLRPDRKGMVYLRHGEFYDVRYGVGQVLVAGDKVELISGGAKPKTTVKLQVILQDTVKTQTFSIESVTTMD